MSCNIFIHHILVLVEVMVAPVWPLTDHNMDHRHVWMREPQILNSAKVFLFKATETNHVQNIAGVDIPPKKDLSTAGWSNVDTLSRLFLGPEKY